MLFLVQATHCHFRHKIEFKVTFFKCGGLLADGYSSKISDQIAEVVYALDMFHIIDDTTELQKELKRIVKPDGRIIIEDGHQPRAKTVRKIEQAGIFNIVNQNKYHVICVPLN